MWEEMYSHKTKTFPLKEGICTGSLAALTAPSSALVCIWWVIVELGFIALKTGWFLFLEGKGQIQWFT